MNFGLIRYDSFLGKILRLPLKLIPNGMIVPILQGRIRSKKWIVGSLFHGCWLGSYEYKKRQIFERFVKEGDVVFDIGANVGFYTILASVLVGEKGNVFAFEPLPRNINYLKRHVDINHLKNVRVIESAVGNQSGEVMFDAVPTFIGQVNYGSCHISDQGSIKVSMVTLDELYQKGDILKPNVLKIDVEGAEKMVLDGGKDIITKSKPIIFLATHGQEVKNECMILLQQWGYQLSSLSKESLEATDEILALPN